MLLILQSLFIALTAGEECWWSGCQLDSWAEAGCFPENEWHAVNKTACDGGNFYKCCKSVEQNGTKKTTTLQNLKTERNDCWWSGCQPNDWNLRGCFPDDEWEEVDSVECENGNKYQCCKKETVATTTTSPVTAECWWSGCQPLEWAERGCFPVEEWQVVNSSSCESGDKFRCCRKKSEQKTNTTELESANPLSKNVEMNFQEFQKAVVDCGYDTPSKEQYKALISQSISKGAISSKRELAMFLAQILWESGGLKYRREIACQLTGCPGVYDNSVGVAGKSYYGRGYIQLTHSYNYKAASQELFSDDRLVKDPDLVADDEQVAWATAFWFWKRNVHLKQGVQQGLFGVTTKAINGNLECKGAHQDRAKRRFELYVQVLHAFNIKEAANERGCYN